MMDGLRWRFHVLIKKHIKAFLLGVKVSEMYHFYRDCGFWFIFMFYF